MTPLLQIGTSMISRDRSNQSDLKIVQVVSYVPHFMACYTHIDTILTLYPPNRNELFLEKEKNRQTKGKKNNTAASL